MRGEGWGEGEFPQTELAQSPLTRRFAPTSPRIRLRQKAGFGGQERGEVNRVSGRIDVDRDTSQIASISLRQAWASVMRSAM
jgi:hypothetical protein